MKHNSLITWVLVAILVWAGISTYWYVCGIKNFCPSTTPMVLDDEPRGEEVANREDEYVITHTNSQRGRRVVTETVTEEVTIQCPSYLNTYIRYGYNNDSQDVLKLEKFLNTYEEENLEENGIFDQEDENAVKRFQIKYRSIVMDPWGMDSPSGFVYTTTRNHINALECAYDYYSKNQ